MEEKKIHIPTISCGHCVMTIKREVEELEGVNSVEGDEKTKIVTIKWENPVTWDKIAETLKETGYPAED
jgi:copper chaperone CopZ